MHKWKRGKLSLKKYILEFRLFNRYVIISCCALFLWLLISWFFSSNMANILFMDYNAPDIAGNIPSVLRKAYISQIMNWETVVSGSMFYLINFLALFFALPTLNFLKEKKSYFVFGRHRFKSLPKSMLTAIFTYSLVAGLATIITFLLFYALLGIFVTNQLINIGNFASIFPSNFYALHPFLFFVFMVCTIYFALAFVFGLLCSGLMLWLNNEYYVLVIVLAFYYLYGYVGGYFNNKWFTILKSVTAFNTLNSTGETFLPLLPILGLALVLISLGVRRHKYNINV